MYKAIHYSINFNRERLLKSKCPSIDGWVYINYNAWKSKQGKIYRWKKIPGDDR
jgi:hypothetical protein